ncbi:hypothetical protein [Pseudarthrobacter oxydans]|uniref:hypothetical protein n=1 Tax=Pseudarthrobacter oxydans TaxID=1671 RepID=UPI001FE56747|nr:hypothetical protein [Pseudarthrobacter oxydans]
MAGGQSRVQDPPRTVVTAIAKATGEELEQDRHGETALSPSDCEFLRTASRLQEANSH